MRDEEFMRLCIELAKCGLDGVSPNPLVGAVLVKDNVILGKGFHEKAGEAHAEIQALRSCTLNARGATLYINLEPCVHTGKTPPCTDAIIRAGIARVVVGMIDPNPLVSGKGIAALKRAGIDVITGVLKKDCAYVNRIFTHWITNKRPYVIAKAAVSADWKISQQRGVRTQITGHETQQKVHALRSLCDAILVGVDTVIVDDPLLTVRHFEQSCTNGTSLGSEKSRATQIGSTGVPDNVLKQPLRIILDSYLRIPIEARVLIDTNVIIATSENANAAKKDALEKRGIACVTLPKTSRGIDIAALLDYCARREITSILVEGGGKVFDTFLEADLINEWHIFQSDQVFGNQAVSLCSDVSLQRYVIPSVSEGSRPDYHVIPNVSEGSRQVKGAENPTGFLATARNDVVFTLEMT